MFLKYSCLNLMLTFVIKGEIDFSFSIILCNINWLLVNQIINSNLIIDKTIILHIENLKRNIKQNNLLD